MEEQGASHRTTLVIWLANPGDASGFLIAFCPVVVLRCDADRPEGPSTAQKGTGKAAASAGKWKCHDCNYSNSGQSRHCFR